MWGEFKITVCFVLMFVSAFAQVSRQDQILMGLQNRKNYNVIYCQQGSRLKAYFFNDEDSSCNILTQDEALKEKSFSAVKLEIESISGRSFIPVRLDEIRDKNGDVQDTDGCFNFVIDDVQSLQNPSSKQCYFTQEQEEQEDPLLDSDNSNELKIKLKQEFVDGIEQLSLELVSLELEEEGLVWGEDFNNSDNANDELSITKEPGELNNYAIRLFMRSFNLQSNQAYVYKDNNQKIIKAIHREVYVYNGNSMRDSEPWSLDMAIDDAVSLMGSVYTGGSISSSVGRIKNMQIEGALIVLKKHNSLLGIASHQAICKIGTIHSNVKNLSNIAACRK